MAEEYNRDALAEEIERQAAELAANAAQAVPVEPEAGEAVAQVVDAVAEEVDAAPAPDALETPAQAARRAADAAGEAAAEVRDALEADALEDAAPEPEAARTELIEIAPEAAQAMPTQAIDPATQAIPAQVDPTLEMPNPYPPVSDTMRIPEPVVTTEGFDVQAVDVIPDTPAPGEVRDPFAPATAAAAAGAAATAIPAAQAAPAAQPAQPASPYPPQGFRQPTQGTYADPNFRQSAQPTYAAPGYQPTYAQPGAYQGAVQHQPFAPDPTVNPYEQSLTQLSGGMKFGWLIVGLMLGIPGMVISWLVNVDKHPQVKHDAIMFSVIGFVIALVLDIIAIIAFTGMIAAAVSSIGAYSGMYF